MTNVTAFHPEGNRKVCTRINGNPSNSFQDISLKNKCPPAGGVREEVRGVTKIIVVLCLLIMMISMQNFKGIYQELLRYGLTQHCLLRATPLAYSS